jgi:DNA polymerase III subunit epsilon
MNERHRGTTTAGAAVRIGGRPEPAQPRPCCVGVSAGPAHLTKAPGLLNRASVEQLLSRAVWVIDCQTTGASPAHGVVLEIGWGLVTAAAPHVQHAETYWVALPRGERVSARVRELTGFDAALASDALAADEVWRRLRASMGHAERAPAAIHFAKFELAFLRDWSSRFEPDASFPLDAVCLHAIATRLHPDLPRQSLRALAGYLGHGIDLVRRCAPHVEASAFIWHKLVAELAERGVFTWEELASWLGAPKPARVGPKKRRFALPSARYRSLPDAPGVYRFLRANGGLLYVGKAASLKRRVSGHFTAGVGSTPRALEMLSQIHDIQVSVVPSALEAALLENEEIKSRKPLYNLQLVQEGPSWFVDSGLASAARAPDAGHRRGPLPSTFSVRALGAILALARGEPASLERRATAVEVPERWAPAEALFAEAFQRFVEQHALRGSGLELRRRSVDVARRLLTEVRAGVEAEVAPEAEGAPPEAWDVERVLRHLERAVAHGQQLLERARWLCLLCESLVEFREPGSDRTRRLGVRLGHPFEVADVGPGEPEPAPGRLPPLGVRQAAFDRAHYDRLRTLTTELKRIQRDGGSVAVRLAGRRWFRGETLERILRWV